MDRPTCSTCPHWDDIYDYGPEPDLPPRRLGTCKRFPPVFPPTEILLREAEKVRDCLWSGWQPETAEGDGCGEHPAFGAWAAGWRATDGNGRED